MTGNDERSGNETTIGEALESIGLSADEVTLDAFLGHFLRTWGVDLESVGSTTILPDFSAETGTSRSVTSEEAMRQAQHDPAEIPLVSEEGTTVGSIMLEEDRRRADRPAIADIPSSVPDEDVSRVSAVPDDVLKLENPAAAAMVEMQQQQTNLAAQQFAGESRDRCPCCGQLIRGTHEEITLPG